MRHFSFFILVACWSSLSLAQKPEPEKSSDIDELLDELFIIDTLAVLKAYEDLKGGFLYASISFDEQAYFSGRDFNIDQFGIAPSLTYLSSGGTYLFAGGFYYSLTPHGIYLPLVLDNLPLGTEKQCQLVQYTLFMAKTVNLTPSVVVSVSYKPDPLSSMALSLWRRPKLLPTSSIIYKQPSFRRCELLLNRICICCLASKTLSNKYPFFDLQNQLYLIESIANSSCHLPSTTMPWISP